jgi:hypothetical protein
MWRIVMNYADYFYAHIAFFDVQFILCMSRMISIPAATSSPTAQLVDLCSVVLNMSLCMAYWIENVLAGRPLEEGAVTAGRGTKRKWSTTATDSPERAVTKLKVDPSDVSMSNPPELQDGACLCCARGCIRPLLSVFL